MLVKFSNHIPHLVVGTLLLPDRESAKIHSNQANPIIRGPNQSLTSPTGMHNSLPLLNPNYSIGNVHPFGLGRKPIGKRVNRTLKRIKAELRRRMHHDIYEVAEWLGRVTGGWLRYYAVPTSFPSLKKFVFRLKRLWLRALRRRSQKDRFTWNRVGRLAEVFWPSLRIMHPWPNTRFAVKHPR